METGLLPPQKTRIKKPCRKHIFRPSEDFFFHGEFPLIHTQLNLTTITEGEDLLRGTDPITGSHFSIFIPRRLNKKLQTLYDNEFGFDNIWIKSKFISPMSAANNYQIYENDDLRLLSRKPVCPKRKKEL